MDALAQLVARSRREPVMAEAAVELCEEALRALGRALVAVGQAQRRLRPLRRRTQRLHQLACAAAQPEPEALGRRLLALEREGLVSGAAGLYADVLGPAGRTAYQQAERARAALPPLGPGDMDPAPRQRARLREIMEALCWRRGDLVALLEVMGRDLSRPEAFAESAEISRELGLAEEARAGADRGRAAFSAAG